MDDKEFKKEEVKQVIESLQHKKAPGPNGITNEIIKLVFKEIPKNDSDLQRTLENRALPSKLENSKDPPNSQTGKRKECRHIVPPNQLIKYRRKSTGKSTKQKNNTPPIHDRILKRKPIPIHTPKEYGRRRYAS